MKKLLLIFLVIGLVVIAGCTNGAATYDSTIDEVLVYKSATCGCCVGWIPHLKSEGFNVKPINTVDMGAIKSKYNIPGPMQSCHTAIIGDYFVEGHMPMEAVRKLLEEKPDIDGIALPGMPAGSLGMPGIKSGTWTIYAIKDGQISTFMEV